jgi:hypothetical protein
MTKCRAGPARAPASGSSWPPRKLTAYLLELQAQHRAPAPALPARGNAAQRAMEAVRLEKMGLYPQAEALRLTVSTRTVTAAQRVLDRGAASGTVEAGAAYDVHLEVVAEAECGIFNADHIVHLLVGHQGRPWALSETDAGGHGAPVPMSAAKLVNLPFVLNQAARKSAWARQWARRYPELLEHNRRFNHAMNLIRGLPFLIEENRSLILRKLANEQHSLKPPYDPTPTLHRAQFWTPLVCQLEHYLRRTTKEPEGKRFAIVARILWLASSGRFPNDPGRVKQRWYRGMRLTKTSAPARGSWELAGRSWSQGDRVRLSDGSLVRIVGVAPEGLIEALLIAFVAVRKIQDMSIIGPAVSRLIDAEVLLRATSQEPLAWASNFVLASPKSLTPLPAWQTGPRPRPRRPRYIRPRF